MSAWATKIAYEEISSNNQTRAILVDAGIEITSSMTPKFFWKIMQRLGIVCEIKDIKIFESEEGTYCTFLLVIPRQLFNKKLIK